MTPWNFNRELPNPHQTKSGQNAALWSSVYSVNYIVPQAFLDTHIYLCLYIFLFFRDNGITVQILKYQLYCEGYMFLSMIVLGIIPIENDIFIGRILGNLFNFVDFVLKPLFYLNGDVNFRNRVLEQGLWRALKKELFQSNTQIQPVSPNSKKSTNETGGNNS